MIVTPLELLAFVSGVMTLEPGDVIMTGTPPGVGPLAAGQTVTIAVEGVGRAAQPGRLTPRGLRRQLRADRGASIAGDGASLERLAAGDVAVAGRARRPAAETRRCVAA